MHLSARTKRLIIHDLAVFAGALAATGVLSADHLTRDVVIAAIVTAVKVTARQLLPVPAADNT